MLLKLPGGFKNIDSLLFFDPKESLPFGSYDSWFLGMGALLRRFYLAEFLSLNTLPAPVDPLGRGR